MLSSGPSKLIGNGCRERCTIHAYGARPTITSGKRIPRRLTSSRRSGHSRMTKAGATSSISG